jgi:hypothetical protein
MLGQLDHIKFKSINMKNKITLIHFLFFLCLFLFSNTAFSQAPEKLSYQSVIRRTNNDLVVNQNVRVKISILQGTITGTAVYVEDHSTSTNSNGLVSLSIGGGNLISGSFSAINWEIGPYFVKMEADPTGGTNYTVSGTSQLLSVPYALYAKTSGSSQASWNSNGNTGTNPSTNFMGTTDAKDLIFKTNNTERLRINSGGRVGIGTSSPQEMLHVKSGNIKVESTNADRHVLISENGGLELFRSAATTSPETNGFIDFKDTLTDDFDHRIFYSNKNFLPPSGGLIFASGPIRKDRLVILNNGNIGIGVSNPTGKFQVKNDVSGSDSSFIVTTAGKIGIGTISPSAKLDVSGTVKIADGTQGSGKVLTSDASGNASWQTAAVTTGSFTNMQVYSTSGTSTFTVPAGVTKIMVEVWGGGGGGGNSSATVTGTVGSGAGGGYGRSIFSVVPGQNYSVVVGAGGVAGSGDGGTSSFGSIINATGGIGGNSIGGSTFKTPNGGTSNGTFNVTGGQGVFGGSMSGAGTYGGGSYGSFGGRGALNGILASSGNAPGGGGGSGSGGSGATALYISGAVGAVGRVVIWY